MVIRPATNIDLEQLLKLWKEQYELHYKLDAEYFVSYTPELQLRIEGYLKKAVLEQDPLLFVADHEGIVVGFVTFKEETELYLDTNVTRFGLIYEIFVAPEARGSGVGAQLLAFVEKFFSDKGIKYIKLSSSTFNQKANDFYVNNGYVGRIQMFIKAI